MTQDAFENREKAAETAAAREEEFRFKVNTRAVRQLGLWAAELLGLDEDAAKAYAEEALALKMNRDGVKKVIQKIHTDLAARGIDRSERHVENQLEAFREEARPALD